MRTDLQEARKQEEKKEKEQKDAEKGWKKASDESEALKAKESELREAIRQAKEEAEHAYADYQHGNVRLQELRNLTERYEGFGFSVRRIMEDKHDQVHGVVVDLIRTDKQYSEAIETALGRSVSNIVTDDEETA